VVDAEHVRDRFVPRVVQVATEQRHEADHGQDGATDDGEEVPDVERPVDTLAAHAAGPFDHGGAVVPVVGDVSIGVSPPAASPVHHAVTVTAVVDRRRISVGVPFDALLALDFGVAVEQAHGSLLLEAGQGLPRRTGRNREHRAWGRGHAVICALSHVQGKWATGDASGPAQ
jgi:hypothetical protein